MSLLDVRTKFTDFSGRHDLPSATVDWLINSGQKILDRLQDTDKSSAWFKKDINAGDYLITMERLITVIDVFITNSEGKSRLKRRDHSWIEKNYANDLALVDQSTPLYWTPAITGLSPEGGSYTSADGNFTYDIGEILFGDYAEYNSIVIMPPTDITYTISVLGKWYQPKLVADTDVSYWTEFHDDLLVLAGMYALERFYRNREGMADYMTAIREQLSEIDNRLAESEYYNIDQMRG